MHGVGLIGTIFVGLLAGWIAEQVMKRNQGLWANLGVGIVGAVLGGFCANLLGIHWYGLIGSLVISTLGAILLLFILDRLRSR